MATGWVRQVPLAALDRASAVTQADLVVAVVISPHDELVAFDIGFALGRRKPLVVVSDLSPDHLPTELRNVPVVPSDGVQDAAVRAIPVAARHRHLGPTEASAGFGNEDYRRALRRDPSPANAVNIVAELLQTRGSRTYVEQRQGESLHADLVVWEPSLSSRWNPVVFEVKQFRVPDRAAVANAVEQLRLYCNLADTRLGVLLLTGDSPSHHDADGIFGRVVIVTFGAEELVSSLEDQRLGPVLMDRVTDVKRHRG
jgi:hypothetical protein